MDDAASAPREVIVFRNVNGFLFVDFCDYPQPSYWTWLDSQEIYEMTRIHVCQQGREVPDGKQGRERRRHGQMAQAPGA